MEKNLYKRGALFLFVLMLAGCLLATQSYGRTESVQPTAHQAPVPSAPVAVSQDSVWAVLALIVSGAGAMLVTRRRQSLRETSMVQNRRDHHDSR